MKLIRLRSSILFFSIFFTAVAYHALSAEPLPPIDAERFDVKPIQKSTSGKIYLFESNQVIPKTGNLILIYDQEKPAMAFRILKNDPEKKQFVGKRIRRYDQTSELTLSHDYSTLEKIADVLPPPPNEEPTPSPAPVAEPTPAVEIVASPTPSPTPDVSPSPTPSEEITSPEKQDAQLDSSEALDKIDKSTPSEEGDDEDDSASGIDETSQIDPFNNILSVGTGYFGNSSNFSGSSIYNNGFSFSYAHVLFHDLFVMNKSVQDSLGIEMGGIYYRAINKDGVNDQYSMLPFYGELLYQLHFSSTFALAPYSGLQYNYMTSANNPGKSLSLLQGFQINVGLGILYSIGPQWLIRADLGWDRITGGLSIKW